MQYFHIFNASPHIDKYMLSSVIMLQPVEKMIKTCYYNKRYLFTMSSNVVYLPTFPLAMLLTKQYHIQNFDEQN